MLHTTWTHQVSPEWASPEKSELEPTLGSALGSGGCSLKRRTLMLQSKKMNLSHSNHLFKQLEQLIWLREQEKSQHVHLDEMKARRVVGACSHHNCISCFSNFHVFTTTPVFCSESYHICKLGNGQFKIHSDRIRHIFHWPNELVVLREEFVE